MKKEEGSRLVELLFCLFLIFCFIALIFNVIRGLSDLIKNTNNKVSDMVILNKREEEISNRVFLELKEELRIQKEKDKKQEQIKLAKEKAQKEREQILNSCNLDYTSCLIKKKAIDSHIDWKVAVAIAKWETGHYRSNACVNYHNYGGMMTSRGLMRFNSREEGINRYILNLKNKYFNKGLNTVSKISFKYAPVNTKNDPNKMNNSWVSGVLSIKNNL